MVDDEATDRSELEVIEDEIASRLQKECVKLKFAKEQIIVATADAIKTNGVLVNGGIMLHYSGSNTETPLVNGHRMGRRLRFTVSVGRKMSSNGNRLTGDVERIVDAITRQSFLDNKIKLAWAKDAFLMVYNGVGIHNIEFTALIDA